MQVTLLRREAKMFKDKLLLGQYYPASSVVHRLSAQSKIIASLLYMISLFVVDSWWGWSAMAVIFFAVQRLSKVPLRALWRGLRLIAIFCLITVGLNIFVYPSEQVLVSWGKMHITEEGLSYGLAMGLRLLLLVAFASLLTFTTTPIALTDGLEALLKPLSVLKVPAQEIAMMMSIALRFIPTILEEFDRIILAQKARGADISQGKLLQRIKMFVPILVPLFVSAFRRADDLAQAMEAKCYQGGASRTRWKVTKWRHADTVTLVLFLLLLAASIVGRALL